MCRPIHLHLIKIRLLDWATDFVITAEPFIQIHHLTLLGTEGEGGIVLLDCSFTGGAFDGRFFLFGFTHDCLIP